MIWTKGQKQMKGEKMVFSTKTPEITASFTKMYASGVTDISAKMQNYKTLRMNRAKSSWPWVRQCSQVPQQICKCKTNRLDSTEIKKFYSEKDTIKIMRRQVTGYDKYIQTII